MVRRSPAIFLGDALGLDFLNSIATPVDTPVDWIGDGEGYLSWLEQAQLVPADVLREMRKRALPGELDGVADQARSLREWFRGFVQQRMGRPLTTEALGELKPLNRLLERDEIFYRVAPAQEGRSPSISRPRAAGVHPDALLLPVGETLGRLVWYGGLLPRQGLRRSDLYAAVCRSHAGPRTAVVQHGDVRQSREAGSPPTPTQSTSTLARASTQAGVTPIGTEGHAAGRRRDCRRAEEGGRQRLACTALSRRLRPGRPAERAPPRRRWPTDHPLECAGEGRLLSGNPPRAQSRRPCCWSCAADRRRAACASGSGTASAAARRTARSARAMAIGTVPPPGPALPPSRPSPVFGAATPAHGRRSDHAIPPASPSSRGRESRCRRTASTNSISLIRASIASPPGACRAIRPRLAERIAPASHQGRRRGDEADGARRRSAELKGWMSQLRNPQASVVRPVCQVAPASGRWPHRR